MASGGCFSERLSDFVPLSANERATLDRLQERERQVRRGTIVFRENDRASDIFIVEKGMLMSYVVLDDGSRQILRFLFPGDLAGVSTIIYRNCPETIEAVTDATLCPFDRSSFAGLFEQHPRLAALILAINQIERVALTDRLAGLGRTSAKARVAAILLDLRARMRRVDKTIGDTISLGLTQEDIGDATGLTAVHVNRMLRQLEDEGLIAREGSRVTIRDEAGLVRGADYTDRYSNLDLSWLPPGR